MTHDCVENDFSLWPDDKLWDFWRQCFPPFGQLQVDLFLAEATEAERLELDQMFAIQRWQNRQPSELLIATCLYCKPHDPHLPPIEDLSEENLKQRSASVKDGRSWWECYCQPIVDSLPHIPEAWRIRIYLAADLEGLLPKFEHPRIEVALMAHSSVKALPGMLWRHLAMEEEALVLVRDADWMVPTPYEAQAVETLLDHAEAMFLCEAGTLNQEQPQTQNYPESPDHPEAEQLIFRPMNAHQVYMGPIPLDIVTAAKAWIWHQWRQRWPRNVTLPGESRPRLKFGLSHWAVYGQDEQFLAHWLFYQAIPLGMLQWSRGQATLSGGFRRANRRSQNQQKTVWKLIWKSKELQGESTPYLRFRRAVRRVKEYLEGDTAARDQAVTGSTSAYGACGSITGPAEELVSHHYIPYVNRMDLLENAIISLPPWLRKRTVVIDNRDRRDVPDPEPWCRKLEPSIEVIRPPVSLTTAQTMNLMFRLSRDAGHRFFTWMHNDGELETPDVADRLYELVTTHMASSRWGMIYTHYDVFCAVNVEALAEIDERHPWDQLRFPYYWLDNDISQALRSRGYDMIESSLPVKHNNGRSNTIKADVGRSHVSGKLFPLSEEFYREKWGQD